MVVERTVDFTVVLSAIGTIDLLTTPQFQQHVNLLIARQPSALIIDLSRVDFLGSAGIGVLINTYNTAGDMAYAVVADGPATSRPLHILSIDSFIGVYPTVADAIAGMGLEEAEAG